MAPKRKLGPATRAQSVRGQQEALRGESREEQPPVAQQLRAEDQVLVEDVPGDGEGSSSVPSVQLGDQMGPQVQPPPVNVALPTGVDYNTIAAIVAQATAQALQQGLQQWSPNIVVQPTPPPPQVKATGTRAHFEALKKSGLSNFEGGPDALMAETWLGNADRLLGLLEVPDELKAQVIAPFFTAGAAKWWRNLENRWNETQQAVAWKDVREAFLDHYFPSAVRAQKRAEFYRWKQVEGMTIVDYAHGLETLGQFVPVVWQDEGTRMYHFQEGLQEDIRDGIVLGQPATYKDMFNLAVQIEGNLNRKEGSKRLKQATLPQLSGKPSQRLERDQQGNRSQLSRRELTIAPTSSGVSGSVHKPQGTQGSVGYPECGYCHLRHPGECRKQSGACYKCGQKGHVIKDCPLQTTSRKPSVTCFNCGQEGHIARHCYQKAGEGQVGSSQSGMVEGEKKKVKPRVYSLVHQGADTGGDEDAGT